MKASVIGGGSWGSAFALHLARLKIATRLWVREQDLCREIQNKRENRLFLPGFRFPAEVSFHDDIGEALVGAETVFVAVPSRYCRGVYTEILPWLSDDHVVVSLTKGIEEDTLKRMSEIMEETFSEFPGLRIAVLSGPSFAREVAEGHPTAVVVASKELAVARKAQRLISNIRFRAYSSDDIIGVELAGSVKNVIAIAAGISDALKFGTNSRAALITRGIVEMARLGVKCGARKETFFGLAGIGDLVLTCTGELSRNRFVGCELGKGKSLPEIISGMPMVAEGVTTTLSVRRLAERKKTEMPICEQVYQVLYKNKNPEKALLDLMSRKLKEESVDV